MPLHAASVVLPSKHSPGPSPYIGWKWSKPQMPSKPRESASCARDASSGQGIRCWAMSSPKRMDALLLPQPDEGQRRLRLSGRRASGVEADVVVRQRRRGGEDADGDLEEEAAERGRVVHAHR